MSTCITCFKKRILFNNRWQDIRLNTPRHIDTLMGQWTGLDNGRSPVHYQALASNKAEVLSVWSLEHTLGEFETTCTKCISMKYPWIVFKLLPVLFRPHNDLLTPHGHIGRANTAQTMACRMTAPNHYRIRWLPLIDEAYLYNFTRDTLANNP